MFYQLEPETPNSSALISMKRGLAEATLPTLQVATPAIRSRLTPGTVPQPPHLWSTQQEGSGL